MQDSSPLVPLHWIDFGYAALVAPGGITGYAKAGSVLSLAAGLLCSGLVGLGTYQLSQDREHFAFPSYFWNHCASLLMVAKLGVSAFCKLHQ